MTLMTLNNMRRVFFFIAVVAMMATSAFAQQPTATTERGKLAPTPPMGWMTWNMFKGDISEQLIKETADAMVESGFFAKLLGLDKKEAPAKKTAPKKKSAEE